MRFSFARKWLIYRFFAYERDQIIKAHPYTFPQKKTKSKDSGTWADTILAMSQTGDEDKVAKTKLAIILRRIENDNKNYEKLKKETEQS